MEHGYLHQTDLSIQISRTDSILAILFTKVELIFASDGFLHQVCWDQSDANIRIPLYLGVCVRFLHFLFKKVSCISVGDSTRI